MYNVESPSDEDVALQPELVRLPVGLFRVYVNQYADSREDVQHTSK